MLLALFVTLTLLTPSPAPPASRHPAAAQRHHAPATLPAGRVNDLYSRHARARIASYLRLRLLELREEHLDRAADVLRRRLGVDTLLAP